MKDVECPNCKVDLYIDHDDGDYGYTEGETFEQQCSECGYVFVYTTEIHFSYAVEKAPCKNGGKHQFEQSAGYPPGYMKNEQRCKVCGEDHLIDDSLKYDNSKDEWN